MTDLLICKTKESDIDLIVTIENHHENLPFIIPNSKEEHHGLLTDDNIEHLLLKNGKNKIIGFVILAGLKDKKKNIEFRRIIINDKGKGYGRTAIRKLKKHCFEKLKCRRLWLDVLENNERAKHLYSSEGFKEDKKLREPILMIGGKSNNLLIMSLLENECNNTITKN
ncbi:GNAT family N-acetyltransferase [Muriicola sp. Z0-33]|uniref:GNAT family N-acetyltransferase n=1 Tax=Muriicola sp. Z0-33 TaxID=2816957 RepID=UPI0022373C5B|nr:GNAT family N-acetyltransferase [Muriicola sp. Z0-33]MCW5516946.1 GNAT family N-acetyltransferase [Muriicola sp. Z0-33]